MSTSSERPPFVAARFIEDLEKGSKEMEAPIDTQLINTVIGAYGDVFYEGAVQIRGSNAPGRPLMFRVLLPNTTSCDTVDISLKNGWLQPDHPLIPLVYAIRSRFKSCREQPEFSVDKGLDGVFIYLGKLRPLEEALAIPQIPDGIRAHKQTFADLGLDTLQYISCDYVRQHVCFVFLAQGPLSKQKFHKFVALTGAPQPAEAVYNDISGVLLSEPFYMTFVMDFATGKIVRVEVFLLFPIKLPDEMRLPELGDRLATFWDIPSYENEDMDILSYCFGDTSMGDILALRSHCGGMRQLFKSWDVVGA